MNMLQMLDEDGREPQAALTLELSICITNEKNLDVPVDVARDEPERNTEKDTRGIIVTTGCTKILLASYNT